MRVRSQGAAAETGVSSRPQIEEPAVLTLDLGDGSTMEFMRIEFQETRASSAATDTAVHGDVLSLYFGRREVTNAQFRRFQTDHNSNSPGAIAIIPYQKYIRSLKPELNTDDQPAVYVQWEEAQGFAEWLGEQTGFAARLPTEAEWEYARRAGAYARYAWGDDTVSAHRFANTNDPLTTELFRFGEPFPLDDGFRATAPVGSFEPNRFGLFDMHGNVAEWTADIWSERVLGPLTADPSIPTDPRQRVVKGGDFTCGPHGEAYFGCTCESRSWNYLGNANFGTGFRVVIEAGREGPERER